MTDDTKATSRSRTRQSALMIGALLQFPPVPTPPERLIGRETVFNDAVERLARQGVVCITGVAGSGKSVLAATIARQWKQAFVWVTLSEGADALVDELLWQLVQPISVAEPQLVLALDQMRQAQYPALVRLQLILAAYARQSTELLICIDQIEHAIDPVIQSLLVALCDYVVVSSMAHIALIVIGRSLPYRLRQYMLAPLQGLSTADIADWAKARGLTLSSSEIEQISDQTGGLPLAVETLWLALTDQLIPLQQIMTIREMRLLAAGIINSLPVAQQQIMADIALHPDHYTSIDPGKLALIQALEQQHLVTIRPIAIEIHPFLENYYQQLLQ